MPHLRGGSLFCVALFLAVCAARAQEVLKLGVGTSVITPFLDEPMAGYYYDRFADGVHDDLFAKAMYLDDGKERVVMIACDLVRMPKPAADAARESIQKRLGLPIDHVMVSATHSHTGPQTTVAFNAILARRIADAATTARGNARPARLSVGQGEEPTLSHNRRYHMKDGTTVTNPGFLNADIVEPAGPINPHVPVLLAEDERGQPIATWVNFAMHLDTVGGTWISSDYAFYLSRLLARVKGPDMLTIFTIGSAGNINHWDVKRPGPQRGFDEARRIGESLGAAVVKAYTQLTPLVRPRVRARSATLDLPVPAVSNEEMAATQKVLATPPTPGVDFTLERVRATRVLAQAAYAGKPMTAEVQVIAWGPIAFVGIPGELFVELGQEIQRASPFKHTFIVELANDTIGYIPTKTAFAEGGYEPTSARFAPGGGELIAAKAIELLRQMGAN